MNHKQEWTISICKLYELETVQQSIHILKKKKNGHFAQIYFYMITENKSTNPEVVMWSGGIYTQNEI